MTLGKFFKNVIADIRFDREMNRRVPSWKDYLRPLFVPQLCCLAIYRLSRLCYLKKHTIIAKILRNFNVVLFGIDIQPDADITGGCFIGHSLGVVVGPHAHIEKGCMIFQGVTITPGTHPGIELADEDRLVIGKRVKIYAGAKVLGNLTIGSDVTIGANAVVLDSVPSGETVMGIPAKPIKRKKALQPDQDLMGTIPSGKKALGE